MPRVQTSYARTGGLFWRRLLWSLVYPVPERRVVVTLSGGLLIALSVGIGLAAYNTASNILFITLALLLGCLVLSGVLSWLNFRGLRWRLEVQAPLRAGREHPVALYLDNSKTLLPTYCLTFDVRNSSQPQIQRISMGDRIDPAGSAVLSWMVCPAKRGMETIELAYVGSPFPFGFLHKRMPADTSCDLLVWPAPVEYQRLSVAAWARLRSGETLPRAGQGSDLHTFRRYQTGDSHRQIHWKASARLGKLIVRQHAAEGEESFILHVQTDADVWRNAQQFELLCSLAGSLAEDLFRISRLEAVSIDAGALQPVRGVRDVDAFLDRLAALQPSVTAVPGITGPGRSQQRNIMTFAPEGARGVAAYVNGEKAAAA